MGSALLNAILDWLQINRIRLASFDQIVASVPGAATYNDLTQVVRENPGVFRTANIKGVGPGLALVDSFRFPDVVPAVPLNVNDLNATARIATEPVPLAGIVSGYATNDQAQPIPTSQNQRELTPHEVVNKLLNQAANADVSGTALNYANAAVAAASAAQLLRDAE